MKCVVVLALCLAPFAVAGAAPDADPKLEEAKQRYESGLAHFNLREYQAAIEDFRAGYRLKPDPVFLYNLAQAHRLAEHLEDALYFYRAYLRVGDNLPNRREVEERVASLEKLLAEKSKLKRPPDQTMAPVEKPAAPAEKPAAPVEKPSVAPAPALIATHEATPPTPVYKKWWFWTIIGGVVVAGASIGLAVALTQSGATFNPSLGTVGPGALTVRF
jgi:tetratricopeptide (TPR) repeat protein